MINDSKILVDDVKIKKSIAEIQNLKLFFDTI